MKTVISHDFSYDNYLKMSFANHGPLEYKLLQGGPVHCRFLLYHLTMGTGLWQ